MRFLALLLFTCVAFAAPSVVLADCSPTIHVTGSISTAQGTDNWFVIGDHRLLTAYVTASRPHVKANTTIVAGPLYVSLTSAPGTGDAWRISVVKDNVETAVTCDISNAETSCTTASTVEFARGEEISIKIDSSTGATAPTNPGVSIFSFCLGGS